MLIRMGEVCDRLYYYESLSALGFQTHCTPSSHLWHVCLGYPFLPCIPKILQLSNTSFHCNACARTKHTQLPFSLILNKNLTYFKRIYCDI